MATKQTHSIYAIYCQDTEEVYIGRSANPKARFKQHLSNKGCVVYEHASKYGKDHLYMVVLKSGIPAEQICAYEAKYIYEFYFKVRLMNRTIPSFSNLVPFCTSAEATEQYCDLVDMVERDLNGDSPRVSVPTMKNRSTYYHWAKSLLEEVRIKAKKIEQAKTILQIS